MSDKDYRIKVSTYLKKEGHLIEAHEAFTGKRYDDPDQGPFGPMSGLIGATAKALQNKEFFPNDLERQLENDAQVGFIVTNENGSIEYIQTIFEVFGDEGMDILLGMQENKKSKKDKN